MEKWWMRAWRFTHLRQIAEGLLDVHQLREDARFELRWDLMAYRYSLAEYGLINNFFCE